MAAFTYNGMKGEPYGRWFTITPQYLALADPARTVPLVQGNMTIQAEKAGTYYLPALHLIGIRAQKAFVIKDTLRLHVMLNIFNLTGAHTVTGVYQTTGTFFNQPTAYIGDRVVRFSSRFTF